MTIPAEWAVPYWISNGLAVLLLILAWKKPAVARFLFAFIFLGAGVVNSRLALMRPEEYLDYAQFALLDVYRQFILGFFAENAKAIVLAIAAGQLVCGGLLLQSKTGVFGAIGAGIFLLAIAPLGVGSAFPFSLICLPALWLATRTVDPVATPSPDR